MISIITPARIETIEQLQWLNEMVESIVGQMMQEWELILMDDASPMSITLNASDDRIRYFRMVNRGGPALCRNTAVRLARYDALLPVDADDLLSFPDVLGTLFSTYQKDPSKVIYGDLQRYERLPTGQWQKGKRFDLPEYTFLKSMDLNGIIPVTALHSYDCHMKAGGWKPQLEAGLEDVEYWIGAGKAGFCGQRVPEVVLLYRKHDSSRTAKLLESKRNTEMRNAIRELHTDVFEGRYPMGCCGGGRPYVPPDTFTQANVSAPSTLDKYSSQDKVWVEYTGQRQGSFGMVGRFTNISYVVNGPGHKIEVHVNDLPQFRRSGRGLDFSVGVQAPNGKVQVIEVKDVGNSAFVAPEPQIAQIERLDGVMA